jgi:hypothetical protein
MQGAYINVNDQFGELKTIRPKTKKALKEAIDSDPDSVYLQATSVFGNEYDGGVTDAPNGTYYVVGPDPYNSRKWYAQVIKTDSGIKVK